MIDLKVYANIKQGDMPGDKIQIEESHVKKAQKIHPVLRDLIAKKLEANEKIVIAVCGGSGVGKSEIGSLLAYMLNSDHIGTYVMSGDNYPHRIPAENDAMREKVYEEGGREALEEYLGSQQEIDFELVEKIVKEFKSGKSPISLKRMGRTADALWFDDVDLTDVKVLIIEWTHSNSDNFQGVDIPILLNSTPEETLAHRRSRNRDGKVDSPFVTMVLEIEQEKLKAQAHKAKIIVSKHGDLLSYGDYCTLMGM